MSEPRRNADDVETEQATLPAVYDIDATERVIVLLRHAGETKLVHVGDAASTIGRGSDATLRVDAPGVSRRHAQLRREGAALMVDDLGSRNGTAVNGKRIEGTQRVQPGDVIRVGPAELTLIVLGPTQAPRGARASTPPARPPADEDAFPEGVIVADAAMIRVFDLVRKVARLSTTVIVLGETGVGKEVVASRIHAWSSRAAAPMLSVNLAALPETLLEAELFGHEKGAFTGAAQGRIGYFERAHGGTLFLDEIGETPPSFQVKLLRALEARRITPVGSTEERAVDVRVVAATHRDLAAEVAAGRFREDLYYRLGAFVVNVPPLRDRRCEVGLLARRFLDDLATRNGVPSAQLSPDAEACLARYPWPGNIRELRNAVEHAFVLAEEGMVLPEHLPVHVTRVSTSEPSSSAIRAALDQAERQAVEEALAATGGNQTRAAVRLGVARRTLLNKMTKFGIKGPRGSG